MLRFGTHPLKALCRQLHTAKARALAAQVVREEKERKLREILGASKARDSVLVLLLLSNVSNATLAQNGS